MPADVNPRPAKAVLVATTGKAPDAAILIKSIKCFLNNIIRIIFRYHGE